MAFPTIIPAAAIAALLHAAVLSPCFAEEPSAPSDRIQPYAENPRYWQYLGRPVVLLGGSKDDNLFQIPDLEEHLRLLASVGGNYVRNTMSARDAGNVQPFARLPDGRYDLGRWDEEYWRRFERLLRLTRALGIVVQIEIWDRFDFARAEWDAQPFNPKNNVNYTHEQSGLAEKYPEHPGENRQPFFYTTPPQRNNAVVLRYQRRFVDELLRRSLPYPNVLYCIDNETSGDPAWSAYWADYVQRRAREVGVQVPITEMWDEWDLQAAQHRRTFDHPERYGFADVSQNNHQRGDRHWNNFHWARRYLDSKPRPINTVKTYGSDRYADTDSWWRRAVGRAAATNTPDNYGTAQHGAERWWRHLIGGAAGVRFHRPPSGLGLNAQAQRHIRSARLFLQEFDIVRAVPDVQHELLSDRGDNEAYLTRVGDYAYAVYFPDGGDVRLALSPKEEFTLTWLDIPASRWTSGARIRGGEPVRLRPPGSGQWLALVSKKPVTRVHARGTIPTTPQQPRR